MLWDNTTLFTDDDPADAAFRSEVRDWIDGHCPRELVNRPDRISPPELKPWHKTLCERGTVMKAFGGELGHRAAELALLAAGPLGPINGEVRIADDRLDIAGDLFASRISVVGGGTTEIQRNVLAKRILGLPS